jgi:Zn-dependent protease with chaperone function
MCEGDGVAASPQRSRRLDPFALPSDGGLRFGTLGLAVAGATMSIYGVIWTTSDPAWHERDQCTSFRWDGFDAPPSYVTDTDCIAAASRHTAVWMLAGLVLLVLVAAVIYRSWPAFKLRWDRLQPLTDDDAPGVEAALAELAGVAGISPSPRYSWNPLNATNSAVAFGHGREHHVALSGGLVSRFYADRELFDAVVLHELAHVRNGDVRITYATMALSRAFVAVAFVPIVIGWIVPMLRGFGMVHQNTELPGVVARLAVVSALVLLMRSAVLRARELYADARASLSGRAASGMRRLLEAMPDGGDRRWWRAALSVHPPASQRRRVLDDTTALFRFGIVEALATGAAAGIALASLASAFAALAGENVGFAAPPPSAPAQAAAAFLVLLPAAVVLAIAAARCALAKAARADADSPLRLGVALGAGVVIGGDLSSVSVGPSGSNELFLIAWSAALVAAAVALAFAAVGATLAWLSRARGRADWRRRIAFRVVGSTLLFAAAGAALFAVGTPIDQALADDEEGAAIFGSAADPLAATQTAAADALPGVPLRVAAVLAFAVLIVVAMVGAIAARRARNTGMPEWLLIPDRADAPRPRDVSAPAAWRSARLAGAPAHARVWQPAARVGELVAGRRLMPGEVVAAVSGALLFGLTFAPWYGSASAYNSYEYTKQTLVAAALLPCVVVGLRALADRFAASRIGVIRAAVSSVAASRIPDAAVAFVGVVVIGMVVLSPGDDPTYVVRDEALGFGLFAGVAALCGIAGGSLLAIRQVPRLGRARAPARTLAASGRRHGITRGEMVAAFGGVLFTAFLFVNWYWDESAWHSFGWVKYPLVVPAAVAIGVAIPRPTTFWVVQSGAPAVTTVALAASLIVLVGVWATAGDVGELSERVETYLPLPVAATGTVLLLAFARGALLDLVLVVAVALAIALILLPTGPTWSGEQMGRDDWSAGVHLGLGALGLIAVGAIAALCERTAAARRRRGT